MSDGETPSASAMLSKPSLEASAGSSVVDVHVQREQVPDRVGVFGPIQPVQRGSVEIGAREARRWSSRVSSSDGEARRARARSGDGRRSAASSRF